VRGFKTRFHLYTVPGQVFYEASRKLILKGADGVAFVADSQEERLDANFETMENLQEHLKEHNLNFATIPYVLQLNKRDLPNAMPVPELTKQLQKKGEPVLEGVAIPGIGRVRNAERIGEAGAGGIEKGRVGASEHVPSRSLLRQLNENHAGRVDVPTRIREGGGFGFEGGDGFDEAGDGESVADTTGAADQAQERRFTGKLNGDAHQSVEIPELSIWGMPLQDDDDFFRVLLDDGLKSAWSWSLGSPMVRRPWTSRMDTPPDSRTLISHGWAFRHV